MPEIQMPKLSDTMTEGTVVAWKKKKGDKVATGDVIAEIETDKATMEWESPEDGVLTEIFVEEGGKVNVGDKLAFIGAEGEAAPAKDAPTGKAQAEKPEPAEKRAELPGPTGNQGGETGRNEAPCCAEGKAARRQRRSESQSLTTCAPLGRRARRGPFDSAGHGPGRSRDGKRRARGREIKGRVEREDLPTEGFRPSTPAKVRGFTSPACAKSSPNAWSRAKARSRTFI